ncbi:MAG: hypothetical protein O7E56_13230 [SAR324 cluster bacterium]|nr:hypothetical protein [SAR324 cluster bacterium]
MSESEVERAGQRDALSAGWSDALFAWSVLLFAGAGLLLLLFEPGAPLEGGSQPALRAIMHLLALGVVLGVYYLLQDRLWERLYIRRPVLPWLPPLIWIFHVSGVALLAGGFFWNYTLMAHVGGHYLVPTAIAASFLRGVFTAVLRPEGAPRHLAAHLPGLGLLVTMGLGAMMVLDAYGGGYGIYTPHTILVHAVAGGFLFFLPFVLCQGSAQAARCEAAPFSSTAFVLLPVGLAAAGVMAVALPGMRGGYEIALPAGLALLGGVALWVGMPWVGLPALGTRKPLTFQALRRSLWSALGVLLLFAAIRAAGGMALPEARELMRFAVTLFLFAVALPEVLTRLDETPWRARSEPSARAAALLFTLLLMVAGLLLVAQLMGSALLVRGAALLGLGALGWQAWRLRVAQRP